MKRRVKGEGEEKEKWRRTTATATTATTNATTAERTTHNWNCATSLEYDLSTPESKKSNSALNEFGRRKEKQKENGSKTLICLIY